MTNKERKQIQLNLEQSELLEESLNKKLEVDLFTTKRKTEDRYVQPIRKGRQVGTFKHERTFVFEFTQYFKRFMNKKRK